MILVFELRLENVDQVTSEVLFRPSGLFSVIFCYAIQDLIRYPRESSCLSIIDERLYSLTETKF